VALLMFPVASSVALWWNNNMSSTLTTTIAAAASRGGRDPKEWGFLYALRYLTGIHEGGKIKIGFTIQPRQRMRTHGYPGTHLELLGFWPARRCDEALIHHRFRKYRANFGGEEIYEPTAEILQVAKQMRLTLDEIEPRCPLRNGLSPLCLAKIQQQ
jgi:T5orf172 domain